MDLWLVVDVIIVNKCDSLRYFALLDRFRFTFGVWKDFLRDFLLIVIVIVHYITIIRRW